MGGRGGSGMSSSQKLNKIQQLAQKWYEEQTKYDITPGNSMKSPYFVQLFENQISRISTFDVDYEITQKQVDTIIKNITSKKRESTAEREERKKTEAAKKYFREHYNPTREQREITSSTYKSAQGRLQKDVDNFFGRGMRKKKRK